MDRTKIGVAFEAAQFMEKSLTPEITAEHEVYMDPEVDSEGTPYVAVTISGDKGVEKLA